MTETTTTMMMMTTTMTTEKVSLVWNNNSYKKKKKNNTPYPPRLPSPLSPLLKSGSAITPVLIGRKTCPSSSLTRLNRASRYAFQAFQPGEKDGESGKRKGHDG